MSDDAEVIGAIVALLVDEGIAAGNVFGDEMPDTFADSMPTDAVEVSPSGGTGFASQSHLDVQRIDVRSYGATPEAARAVALAVHTVLNRLVRRVSDGVLLHSAIPAGGFLSDREIDTRWPYAWRSYSIIYDLRSTA